jgi:chromosomal replication initiation ATPase DnaA
VTSALNPRFTFDTFVVGPANRLAVSAARMAAENPGSAYNPLFIYSASGLGKTHLLTAVGARARALDPDRRVEYLTLEEFVDSYNAAVAVGQGEAFRNRFTDVSVVLIDDIQFLAQRLETQAELLRFITQLLERGNQVVLASDRPPRDIEHLDERLISQFAGGLVVDIGPPEFETRLAILRRKALERGVDFEQVVLSAVASYEARNVRELLGLLNRLIAFQAVNEGALTVEGARTLLGLEGAILEQEGAGATEPVGVAAPEADEFADFLDSVGTALARQVEAWRKRVAEAVEYWDGQGYKTERLSALLEADTPVGAEQAVRAYEGDVDRLRVLEAEVTKIDPPRGGDPVFRDPDRVAEAEGLLQAAREGMGPPPGPSASLTFEAFIQTEGNKLAVTSARAVVTHPGAQYNPFVIVGPNGVGKTHLLHAIGNGIVSQVDAAVACLSAQQFVDEYVDAMERGRLDPWRERYRQVAALLLDDVHLLALRAGTQEELFHLFNALSAAERQLVFTTQAMPQELEGLDDRLVSRLAGGLVVQLPVAAREVRLAVAQRELRSRVGAVDEDVVAYLADRPDTSLHTLIEMVQRIAEEGAARGTVPNHRLARDVIEGGAAPPPRPARRSRNSGLVLSRAGGLRSPEKVVWRWPHVGERLVEDLS